MESCGSGSDDLLGPWERGALVTTTNIGPSVVLFLLCSSLPATATAAAAIMPRARRNKIVSLTKTPKRNTRSAKAGHMDSVRDAAAEYPTCVVFLMANQRTTYLQEVRSLWKANSKIFVGKNRVVAKAIGSDPESEARPGISGISKVGCGGGERRAGCCEGILTLSLAPAPMQRLEGPVGVLFTTSAPDEVQEWFDDYARDDFARAGSVATRDVVLAAGPVMLALEEQEPLPHSLEPRLRQLGMPTELRRGVPTLTEEFVVCKAGDRLTTEKVCVDRGGRCKGAGLRVKAHFSLPLLSPLSPTRPRSSSTSSSKTQNSDWCPSHTGPRRPARCSRLH